MFIQRAAYGTMLSSFDLQVAPVDMDDATLCAAVDDAEGITRPDLLVVDVASNDLRGLEVIRSLRERATWPLPPVVVLAPAGHLDCSELCEELQIAQCLTKPVRRCELEAAIKGVLGIAVQPLPNIVEIDASAGQHALRVLIADDSPVNQEVAAGLLELLGHTVTKASSGREGMEAWQREPFDAILMDVEMHDMDGLTATAAIREREDVAGRRTPIIALTAHAYEGFEERCAEAGMDGHISKPLQPEELYRVLDAIRARAETMTAVS